MSRRISPCLSNLKRITLDAESILQTTARVAGQTMADVETMGVHSDALTKSRYHFTNDLKEGEAIVSARLAKSLDRSVGQTLRVGEETYRICEILSSAITSESSNDQVLLSYADLKKNHPIETKAVLLNLKKRRISSTMPIHSSKRIRSSGLNFRKGKRSHRR